MKNLITTCCYIIFLSFLTFTLNAQEAVNTAGGEATGAGGSASYSVGQLTYHTYVGPNGSVSEGVQQPYEISITTGIENTAIELSMSVFPNPVIHHLTLKIKDDSWINGQTLLYLYDVNGKLLKQHVVVGNETMIAAAHLKPAVYILKVVQNGKEVKVFKVVKD